MKHSPALTKVKLLTLFSAETFLPLGFAFLLLFSILVVFSMPTVALWASLRVLDALLDLTTLTLGEGATLPLPESEDLAESTDDAMEILDVALTALASGLALLSPSLPSIVLLDDREPKLKKVVYYLLTNT